MATGAQIFDEWFVREPTTTRQEFCERIGLPRHQPIILYTCSSQWIAPYEVPFVRRWLAALRLSGEPLKSAGVLIRPHPQNAAQWQDVDLNAFGPVAIWPRDPSARVDYQTKADYFDSLYHSAAVVGINTSALIEAGIIGRPVFTVLDDEYRSSQDGTLHFRYLMEASGGLLRVAANINEHVEQLGAALDETPDPEAANAFLSTFIRPHGLERPATPILANALAALAERKPAAEPTPALGIGPAPTDVRAGAAGTGRLERDEGPVACGGILASMNVVTEPCLNTRFRTASHRVSAPIRGLKSTSTLGAWLRHDGAGQFTGFSWSWSRSDRRW